MGVSLLDIKTMRHARIQLSTPLWEFQELYSTMLQDQW